MRPTLLPLSTLALTLTACMAPTEQLSSNPNPGTTTGVVDSAAPDGPTDDTGTGFDGSPNEGGTTGGTTGTTGGTTGTTNGGTTADSGADAMPMADAGDSGADAGCERKQTFYPDQDGDGLGDPAPSTSVTACSAPDGYVDNADDPQPLCQTNDSDDCSDDALRCADDDNLRQRCVGTEDGCTHWQDGPCPRDTPRCDPDDGASCKGCQSDDDCHFEGQSVCAPSGACVECTRESKEACLNGGTQYACDTRTFTCDDILEADSKALCDVCTRDDECAPNAVCVAVDAGAGDSVCQQLFVSGDPCPRPYFGLTDAPVSTADGASAQVCTFSLATTCEAHDDYRNKRCGTPSPANEDVDQPNSGDNTKCGQSDLDDGYCVFAPAASQYRCTVPCNNDARDCPIDSDNCSSLDHGSGTRNLCTL